MIAKQLNETCACRTFEPKNLDVACQSLLTTHPHLFSATTVFISPAQLRAIEESIAEIELAISRSDYQAEALARSPSIGSVNQKTQGVFMGYDFHLSDEGPKLIEINTNAGGALLNLQLARAQEACCQEENLFFKTHTLAEVDRLFVEMFQNEWRLFKGNAHLKTIAIVDINPKGQYLYPEFQLFQKLFQQYGHDCLIVDPADLEFKDGRLSHEDKTIDLVYNRLTDFYLDEVPGLKAAFESGSIVLTPSPRHHALFANKLNLVTLCQKIKSIPSTLLVSESNQQELWEKRKNFFFKPLCGYGSKATYRGDKLTRTVWQEIIQSPYVAQALVPPSKRIVKNQESQADLKVDIRAYTYAGKILLLAARLYEGQTTNFRTPGGGFAPVYVIEGTPAPAACI